MRLTIEKKIILVVIIFFLIAAGIIAGIIVPSISDIKELDQETVELRSYLERKYQKSHTIRLSALESEQMRSSTKEFPNYLFHSSQTLELVTMLESFASATNVTQKIGATDLDQVTEGKATLSLTVSGDFKNVMSYLRDIENSKYFLNILNLQLTPLVQGFSGGSTAASPVSLSLTLSIYVSP